MEAEQRSGSETDQMHYTGKGHRSSVGPVGPKCSLVSSMSTCGVVLGANQIKQEMDDVIISERSALQVNFDAYRCYVKLEREDFCRYGTGIAMWNKPKVESCRVKMEERNPSIPVGRRRSCRLINLSCKKEDKKEMPNSHFGRSSACVSGVSQTRFRMYAKRMIKRHACSECGTKFDTEAQLKTHRQIHSGERPFPCSECRKSFKRRGGLKEHQHVHLAARPFSCARCGKAFSFVGNLRRHMQVHSGVKPYACSQCGKAFGILENLKGHMMIHTGEKPFVCPECAGCFRRSSTLRRHQLTHSGARTYPCDVCGMAFKRPDTLKCHRRLHSGERPYSCPYCERTFAQRTVSRAHQRIHTRALLKCTECTKSFTRKDCFARHVLTHSGV